MFDPVGGEDRYANHVEYSHFVELAEMRVVMEGNEDAANPFVPITKGFKKMPKSRLLNKVNLRSFCNSNLIIMVTYGYASSGRRYRKSWVMPNKSPEIYTLLKLPWKASCVS